MDTTETYIKMCDNPETQRQRPSIESWKYWHQSGRCYSGIDGEWWARTTGEESPFGIWLPRQDQLQEMVGIITPESYLEYVFNQYFEFADDTGVDIKNPYPEAKTPEQLWLAFVQKELHNKIWDGDKWIIRN